MLIDLNICNFFRRIQHWCNTSFHYWWDLLVVDLPVHGLSLLLTIVLLNTNTKKFI